MQYNFVLHTIKYLQILAKLKVCIKIKLRHNKGEKSN